MTNNSGCQAGAVADCEGEAGALACAMLGAHREAWDYGSEMEIHGSIANNLGSAVKSARRLKGHPVHADTVEHWRELLDHARRDITTDSLESLRELILELENELADRKA
jgi:hypothetical protein